HGHPAPTRVLDLLERTLRTQTPRAIILERDSRLSETDEIRVDLDRLRSCISARTWQKNGTDASHR
ncbi:MAG: hypothetical protein K0Q70_1036, partial [Rhodospirillales bacterium]|nr:hypothetical protein [Rhodospirillales bacterium]